MKRLQKVFKKEPANIAILWTCIPAGQRIIMRSFSQPKALRKGQINSLKKTAGQALFYSPGKPWTLMVPKWVVLEHRSGRR
ncbi:hypothetical protein [Polaromonas sp. UC242_47]|uniref:hypothetical protein n=1 Tax=Polaromonas sp. UC242_47 TaxID=3374626 RepID=UPI00378D8250